MLKISVVGAIFIPVYAAWNYELILNGDAKIIPLILLFMGLMMRANRNSSTKTNTRAMNKSQQWFWAMTYMVMLVISLVLYSEAEMV